MGAAAAMKMAVVSMEMTPGKFPVPAACRNRDYVPRNLSSMAAALRNPWWNMTGLSRVFASRAIYRRRGSVGGVPRGPPMGGAPSGHAGGWEEAVGLLGLAFGSVGLRRNRISIFLDFSEHFGFWAFSAINRHNKQKLAPWNLVNRRCFEVDTGGGVAGVFEGASRIFFADSLTRQGYFEVDTNGDGQKRQTTVAKNILRYLPVLPRIQRLFMTEDTAQQMRWAVEGIRPDSGKMIHPSDGTAWKNFVKKYPLKAGDPRSVAIAISTDGFNPYGPKYPGKNMNVYLEPLIDDLLLGWEDRGIRTYDAAKKEHFDMYVWYHTSLHDLPARALFCGWCTHGKWPCPECRQAVTFFWLNKGGKYSCFDEARQFLEQSHEYRSDVKSFKKGRVVHAPKPIPKTGQETKAELDALQPNPDGNGFLGYGETHQWTHKPCFWKLPYFEFLELPHNIDVMHTEKNISEAIWSTIVDTEKTKDNIKARIDQEKLCDRPELNMQPPHGAKKTWTKPHAPFCLTKAQKREVFQWMKDSLFFPDGFAANWMRGLNIETLRVQGLKSHDYHIWLERIMPVMIRGYVPEKTWRVLSRLSYFFRQICARECLL
ncbi:hypothetical protein QYE76_009503 [Lolium multiflorum]|uniref:Uncharacterized protein n=1 Tax=Lolium multiflorum TaxID=4521 RepID=A0AAD8X1A9_LOLMU|nr:hypothetical protein QYE76_009503 [Lolium multiflorum]